MYKIDSQVSDVDDWMDNRAWGTQGRSRSSGTPEIAELANNRGLLTSPRGHASILQGWFVTFSSSTLEPGYKGGKDG